MKKIFLTLFTILITQFNTTCLGQIPMTQITDQQPFSIGETLIFKSTLLKENRTINIYLPESYHKDSLKKYPVIYLLDGSADEDFIHISGLVQFSSFSWINTLPESIVVGIGNVDRKRDFTYPSNNDIDNKELPTSGKSAPFIKFIADELQDLITKKYRVTPEKTLIGQSLGGLLATEILFTQPELFDNYIIVSPSLWWDDESLLKRALPVSLKEKSVYIGVGKEGPTMERVAQTLFYKLTLEKSKDIKLFFKYFDQLDHGDTLHLSVYDAFEKIFYKEEKK